MTINQFADQGADRPLVVSGFAGEVWFQLRLEPVVIDDDTPAAEAGTFALEVQPLGAAGFEPLTLNGVPVVVDVATGLTVGPFQAALNAVRAVPSGDVDGACALTVCGW